jgi:hypothetical protein
VKANSLKPGEELKPEELNHKAFRIKLLIEYPPMALKRLPKAMY